MTDIMGILLAVKVHAANIHDTVAGGKVLAKAVVKYSTIKGAYGGAGYRKTFETEALIMGIKVDISERIKPEWEILPKRWRVERTFAWMNGSRRLSKDYEIETDSAENMIMISCAATLLRRY